MASHRMTSQGDSDQSLSEAEIARIISAHYNAKTYGIGDEIHENSKTSGMGNEVHKNAKTSGMGNDVHENAKTYGMGNDVHKNTKTYGMGNEVHENAKTYGIGEEIHVSNSCDDNLTQVTSGSFEDKDIHPTMQHIVSVTDCSVTFKIEISGLVCVWDNVLIPTYVNVSKEEALNWLKLLGYKLDNNFTKIDGPESSDKVQVKQEFSFDDSITHETTTKPVIMPTKRPLPKSSNNTESDQSLFKKIKLDKEFGEDNGSHSDDLTISDIGMYGDTMDTSLLKNEQHDVTTKIDHGDVGVVENQPSTSRPKQHGSPNKKYKRFKCKICQYRTASSVFHKLHAKKHANGGKIPCEHCDYSTENPSHFLRHTSTRHQVPLDEKLNVKPFKCELCQYRTASSALHILHAKKHAGDGKLTCEHCNYTTDISGNFLRHTRRRHSVPLDLFKIHSKLSVKRFKCELCHYGTDSSALHKLHAKKHASGGKLTCEHCDYSTENSSNFLRHTRRRHSVPLGSIKIHSSNKKESVKCFKCEHCHYRTTSSAALELHAKKHSGGGKFKCAHCDYSTTITHNFQRHMQSRKHTKKHTGVAKLASGHCDYSSKIRHNFERHNNRKHSEPSSTSQHQQNDVEAINHQIVTEGKQDMEENEGLESSADCLDRHQDIEENEGSTDSVERHVTIHIDDDCGIDHFTCERCTFQTTSYAAFERHFKKHTKIPTKASDVKRLSKVHTNKKKKVKCSYPGCSYESKQSNITVHNMIHTGVRPYKCPLCTYSSNISSHIKRHMRVHTKERPFSCEHCEHTSSEAGSLRKHVKSKHSNVL